MRRTLLQIHANQLPVQLLPLLRGRVSHVTSRAALACILRDRCLKPNQDSSLGYGSSSNSYFRKLGCLSVTDLRTVGDEQIEGSLGNFNFLNPNFTKNHPVYFLLSPSAYPKLIPWTEWSKTRPPERVVQYTEAGFPCELWLTEVDEIIEVEIENPPHPLELALQLQRPPSTS